jgi:ABC-2 type transport system ATP-binding protein
MIEGLQAPNQGTITISGKTWGRHERYLRKIIGLSLQETRFVDKLTVLETLDLFGSFYGLDRSRSREVVDWVGLGEKKNAYTVNLSGGQRQKLALGVALLNRPRLLLLDEPTTGLDPNARREIWEILTDLKKGGETTLILTTHYMEEAQYLCDRIVVLDRGEILADGTLEDLLGAFATGELIEFELRTAVPPDSSRNCRATWRCVGRAGPQGHGDRHSITEALPVLLALFRTHHAEVLAFQCRKKTLEDLFVALTGRRLHE